MLIDGTMVKETASIFAEKSHFPNFIASVSWMDEQKKGKEKYTPNVNKKVIFLS